MTVSGLLWRGDLSPLGCEAAPTTSVPTESLRMNKHIGSDFDDFLTEQGIAEEVCAVALKRIISWQMTEANDASESDQKDPDTADAQ